MRGRAAAHRHGRNERTRNHKSVTPFFPPQTLAQPVYHSTFNAVGQQELVGCPILPIKTKGKGPAPSLDPACA